MASITAGVEDTESPKQSARKFGTFAGVFTPTLLTVLGAIMYLRTGWVVGNAGLLGAWSIVALANIITVCTGLSIASVVTNMRVKAGGAFSIISQSLGLEIGGSISVPFYLAQSISVAFYVFAFTEGWQVIFPQHPTAIVVFLAFALAFAIAFVSADLASRTQISILIIIGLSLVSVGLGSFAFAEGTFGPVSIGSAGFTETPQLFGDFPSGGYWAIFAVYFPAVTGILAGVNMSGNLEDPRKSIPVGTIAAQAVSFVIYMALAYWLSRVASPEALVDNFTLIVDESFFAPLVLAGLLAATFSSALTSLVGSPRILQAIAEYKLVPYDETLSRLTESGEPRPALYVTGVIAISAIIFGLLSGGLNAIAPLMTMFFLFTYTILNGIVVLEKLLGLVSFRPSFDVPVIVPLIGLAGCVFAMFLINPAFSLVAIVVIAGLYVYLRSQDLQTPWSDVRSGLFFTVAEWAARRVGYSIDEGEERAWQPSLLVPLTSTEQFSGSYRFVRTLTYPRGSVLALGLHPPNQELDVVGIREMTEALRSDGIFARTSLIEAEDWAEGVSLSMDVLSSALFRPNVLFLPVGDDMTAETLNHIADRARPNRVGLAFFKRNPVAGLGRESVINVWIRERSPDWPIEMRLGNFHLALLMAYQIKNNWDGQLNLITLVEDPAEQENARRFLKQLTEYGRMPKGTTPVVEVGGLTEYLPNAPRADLNIFGIQEQVNPDFMEKAAITTHSSCLFVRDSGLESALA